MCSCLGEKELVRGSLNSLLGDRRQAAGSVRTIYEEASFTLVVGLINSMPKLHYEQGSEEASC